MEKAVERRLISDVPLGALLSGGLDSSIIVAFMSKLSGTKVNSYSIGFDADGYDESKYANLVADFCDTNHTSLNLNKESYVEDLKKMIIQKDAPLSIPHEIALYRISKKLKELGVEDTLINLKGMTQGMLVILGQKNIKKLSDFADLSSDELIGGFDEIKGKKIRIDGYLEEFSLSRKEADELIMAAREIAYK